MCERENACVRASSACHFVPGRELARARAPVRVCKHVFGFKNLHGKVRLRRDSSRTEKNLFSLLEQSLQSNDPTESSKWLFANGENYDLLTCFSPAVCGDSILEPTVCIQTRQVTFRLSHFGAAVRISGDLFRRGPAEPFWSLITPSGALPFPRTHAVLAASSGALWVHGGAGKDGTVPHLGPYLGQCCGASRPCSSCIRSEFSRACPRRQ